MAIVRTDDQHYHDIADAIRAKTGGTEDILPENMAEELNAAILEALTVTPTTEQQVFEPESPCIGFSSVTVEAAPDSGGGEDSGGDSGGDYPDGETTTFGHIYTNETTTVTKYGGVALPSFPNPEPSRGTPHYVVKLDTFTVTDEETGETETASAYRLYVNYNIFICRPQYNDLYYYASPGSNYYYRYELQSGAWFDPGYTFGGYPSASEIIYTNKNIADWNNNSIWRAADTPVTETVTVKVSDPVEREDEYRMLGDTMNTLCHLAQEASASEELMTPSAALAILGELVANTTTT